MSETVRKIPSNGGIRLPLLSLALATMALGLYIFAGPVPELLVYDRNLVAQGEGWRLLTGHWVHSDSEHLAWNLAALLILGLAIESLLGARRLLGVLLAGTVAIDACLWFFLTGLEFYCGLSGVLNTLLFVGLWRLWQRDRHPLYVLAAAGSLLKIAVEMSTQAPIFTATAWPSVPAAHLAGFAGALVWGAAAFYQWKKP